MIIGVPRERKTLERRVALTPAGARQLIERGHEVVIERGAGRGSFFSDDKYRAAGGRIAAGPAAVWGVADLLVKVKEPHPQEYRFFRPELTVFSFLHLAGLPATARAMVAGGVTGLAYELVQNVAGRFPLLEPMSEAAGKLAVFNGAYFLLTQNGGRGVLLNGIGAVAPGTVVIVGAGTAGRAAAQTAWGLGARVIVLDINQAQLDRVSAACPGIDCRAATPAALAAAVTAADLLISAVLVPGAAAPKLITRPMIRTMPSGAVFVDISVDQGGSGESIRPTTLKKPTYRWGGVIHYAVPNMPSQAARSATEALTSATLPYIMTLANEGILAALKQHSDLRAALNTYRGQLYNQAVAQATGLPYAGLPPW